MTKTKTTPTSEVKKKTKTKAQTSAKSEAKSPGEAAQLSSPARPHKKTKAENARRLPKKFVDRSANSAAVLSSKVSYQGPLFRVLSERVREPDGKEVQRDIIRHNGSVVVLALDSSKSRKNPLVIMEQQYRHAAKQYLVELPAGKLEPGEDPLKGAQRELLEETGFTASRWTSLTRYFASPGFLGEWMEVFVAEELTRGKASPEEDENISLAAIPMSRLLKLIDRGQVQDGKTLVSIMLYARTRRKLRSKSADQKN